MITDSKNTGVRHILLPTLKTHPSEIRQQNWNQNQSQSQQNRNRNQEPESATPRPTITGSMNTDVRHIPSALKALPSDTRQQNRNRYPDLRLHPPI